jgi:hypothetical protein
MKNPALDSADHRVGEDMNLIVRVDAENRGSRHTSWRFWRVGSCREGKTNLSRTTESQFT